MRPILIAPLLLLPLTACQTGAGGNTRIVELYDMVEPTGVIEIEMARDGTLREIEAQVPLSTVPNLVLETARTRFEGAELTGAEREYNQTADCWEIQLRHDGKDMELVIDEQGNILEIEEPIERGEGPASLVENAQSRVEVPPGATLQSIEKITMYRLDGGTEFHVKFAHNDVSYKVVLDDQAIVDRVVREQRAEIEIPLSGS